MATAAEQQSIIQLVVGMVDAAPGADILAELEAIIDAGTTIEELAIAITANPAWSGDTGLFPDFLPNAIFADNFMTQLLGSEVAEADLQAAIDEMTASLNAGDSRGAAIYATIVSLAATTDPLFADAALALANKTAVATYYSVDLAASSADLDDLIAVVSGVTSDADAVTDGEAAVDDAIAGAQPLVKLITDLDAANDAVTAFLAGVDIDGNPLTKTSEANINAQPGVEATAMDAVPLTVGVLVGASAGTQAAFVADQEVTNAAAAKVTATALATAKSATTGTGSITGLDAAISAYATAQVATFTATATETISDTVMATAVTTFDVNPLVADIASYNGVAQALGAVQGAAITSVGSTGLADLITTISKVLTITPGVTEVTNPGITALFNSVVARNAVTKAQDTAVAAQAAALDIIENLDPTAAHITASDNLEAAFSATALYDTPAKILAATPTMLDMNIESTALKGLVQTADLAALTLALDAAATAPAVLALTATAVADGVITTADKTLIDAGADGTANTTESALLAVNSPAARSTAYEGLFTTYKAVAGFAAKTGAFNTASTNDKAALKVISDLATAVAKLDTAAGNVAELKALNVVVTAATGAFADAGYAAPVELTTPISVATAADDVFLVDDNDSQIVSFGAATTTDGADLLFIGEGLTLNAGTTAGGDGDDAVLEVWITSNVGGDAVITVETSVFGSSAAVPETFAITLTGVAAADVVLDGGIVTV